MKDLVWHVLARHKRAAYPRHCAACRAEWSRREVADRS